MLCFYQDDLLELELDELDILLSIALLFHCDCITRSAFYLIFYWKGIPMHVFFIFLFLK